MGFLYTNCTKPKLRYEKATRRRKDDETEEMVVFWAGAGIVVRKSAAGVSICPRRGFGGRSGRKFRKPDVEGTGRRNVRNCSVQRK